MRQRRAMTLVAVIGLAAATLASGAHASPVSAPSSQADPGGATPCDPLDAAKCLAPFPNDYFTVAERSTDTGRRVSFSTDAMPKNVGGVPIEPTEWNRNDGFSPGSAVITFVPGLDLERTGAALSTDIGRSLRNDAPIVLLDTDTGERVPYWAELDADAPDADPRALIVHPAVNFLEGHHIVVALRGLEDASGATIEAGDAFAAYRDGTATDDRADHMDDVFAALEQADVDRDDLYLAWDFTVASERNLSERMLHIRDDAFASLEDAAPKFTVTSVEPDVDERIARRVTGTFTVPSYLTGDGGPGSRFDTGSDGLPQRNGDLSASFICNIPRAALATGDAVTPARPAVYGHGLLGSNREVNAGNVLDMANEHNFVFCATKWIGMSDEDTGNVVSILGDLSKFPTLADRCQQGILNTLMLGRLMVAKDGFVSDTAFQGADGKPVIDTRELFFDANSQGGIIGGAATAVATDWKRAVLGVPGMNYSTLLQRSSDWDTYEAILAPSYPDPVERTLGISIIQMLWDRAEANGYAQHMTGDPYPHTPKHTVLLDEAFGDHQVANVTTAVEARTIGARAHRPVVATGRSTDRVPLWGIPTISGRGYTGSAIVVWDSGSDAPPPDNSPPSTGRDPHEDPRASKAAREQKSAFLSSDGVFLDVCKGRPCTAEPVD